MVSPERRAYFWLVVGIVGFLASDYVFDWSNIWGERKGLPYWRSEDDSAFPSVMEPNHDLRRQLKLAYWPGLKFKADGNILKSVDFWVRIYSRYYTHQGLIHDARYIDHIYEVIDFKTIDDDEREEVIDESRKWWKNVLLEVHRKQKHPEKMTDEELRVFQMFSDVNEPNKFLRAAHRKRLRFQLGQKDHFFTAVQESGRYLPWIEGVFEREGLPWEITRLPFVESGFDTSAYSKVGAAGVWQFMRSTGRQYMTINSALDERNDPYRATEAAAELLNKNYKTLGTWPLAIVAYNHGRTGMKRAVKRMGTNDIRKIIRRYRSSTFGFASRNFFPSLLAAIEVEGNSDYYFGEVEKDEPTPFVTVGLTHYMKLRDLLSFLEIDRELFQLLNLGLTPAVYEGKKRVPAGYHVRLPAEWGEEWGGPRQAFWKIYGDIPSEMKYRNQIVTKRKVASNKTKRKAKRRRKRR